jgi:hypothetical protein
MMKRPGFTVAGLLGAGILAVAILGGGSTAAAEQDNRPLFTKAAIPPGFIQFLVLIGNGKFS